MVQVAETPTFTRIIKKLHDNQKVDVDKAVEALMQNPETGELKLGNFAGIRIYKFKMVKQLTLLAYSWNEGVLVLKLINPGSHENFYRDLKR